ncbi:MAG: hypothetical protein CM1200mP41_07500 [Gammaproteobacteria bacterium]|nr:MAG: hypothetical protein CM1200mP41_07500 [Gammaproteobacteria bacterium]
MINLPYHHPVIVAAETAQFDQMSGGRLILGFGPGGLMSDAELFGMEDMPERYRGGDGGSIDFNPRAVECRSPLRFDGEHFPMTLEGPRVVKPWCRAHGGALSKTASAGGVGDGRAGRPEGPKPLQNAISFPSRLTLFR